MITALPLEQPGRWRATGIALIVLVITLPAIPLLGHVSITAAVAMTGVFWSALGLVYLGADAPAWADPILRSRLTVCVALGLRFLPVAAVIGLWASGSASPSWAQAAGLHGVPLGTYLRRILLPFLLPAGLLSCMLIALLATADIGTVLLLHPPGAGSLPLAIFTVMANAPESLVASLCVIYVALAALLVAGVWTIAGKQRR